MTKKRDKSFADIASGRFCPKCDNEGEIENTFTTQDNEVTECGKCGYQGDPIEFYWLKAEDIRDILDNAESTYGGNAVLTDIEETAHDYDVKARTVRQIKKILLTKIPMNNED